MASSVAPNSTLQVFWFDNPVAALFSCCSRQTASRATSSEA
jgi:hypothetical protein